MLADSRQSWVVSDAHDSNGAQIPHAAQRDCRRPRWNYAPCMGIQGEESRWFAVTERLPVRRSARFRSRGLLYERAAPGRLRHLIPSHRAQWTSRAHVPVTTTSVCQQRRGDGQTTGPTKMPSAIMPSNSRETWPAEITGWKCAGLGPRARCTRARMVS
jgi:hypothetical protein